MATAKVAARCRSCPQWSTLHTARPVLAAGGIADGRGLAAALVLGAAGALVGTRFEATTEALLGAEEVKAIIAATAADTTRDRVLDLAVDSDWPARFTARTLRNRFTDTWHDSRGRVCWPTPMPRPSSAPGVARGDLDYVPIWAGEAVDLITELDTASAVVARHRRRSRQGHHHRARCDALGNTCCLIRVGRRRERRPDHHSVSDSSRPQPRSSTASTCPASGPIVTGASSGIGVETARALAGAGAAVTLAVRDTAAGERVAADIGDAVEVAALDLSDLTSVASFVAAWRGPLDILVNNAGVMAIQDLTLSPSGHEMQFATNHLGHFALAVGLHDALGRGGRRADRLGQLRRSPALTGGVRRHRLRLPGLRPVRGLRPVQDRERAVRRRGHPPLGVRWHRTPTP